MNAGAPFYLLAVETQITTLTAGSWDDGYYDYTLSTNAQFYFYGKKVTHLRISTNGYVVMGFGSASGDGIDPTPDPMPSLNSPNAIAAPWWNDWNLDTSTGGSGEIWVRFSGTYTSIEWRNVAHYLDSTARYRFQVIFFGNGVEPSLYNANNIMSFHYIDTDSGTGTYDHGAYATVGIEHYTGLQCEVYSYNTSSLSNSMRILFTPFVPIYDTTIDMAYYDAGQTTPDYAIFRPSDGVWYSHNFGSATTEDPIQWGTRGDVALPGDFDGDGDADEMVYRPSNSTFYSWDPPFVIPWGTVGDIPLVADFNYDGVSDIAVFRPSDGYWYIKYTGGSTAAIQWGTQGDVPLPADYDGDGYADLTVYRPSDNYWYIRRSSNPASPWAISWGTEGDIPFPMNEFSSTVTSITVFRPSTGMWYGKIPTSGQTWWSTNPWGTVGDHPVPCDFLVNGSSILNLFRPSEGIWYGVYSPVYWGTLGDKPRARRSFQIVAPQPSVGADTR